jgi:hypothetical protein
MGRPVGAATGDAGSGLAGGVVGDRDHLGRLGGQADQVLDRGLAGDVQDGVDPTASGGSDPLGQALAVAHRGRAELAQIVVVGLAGRGDHLGASGERHLHGDRAHATSTAVNEQGVAGVDLQQPKPAFAGLADLVDHAGGVVAEVPGAGHGLAAGQRTGHGFPVLSLPHTP